MFRAFFVILSGTLYQIALNAYMNIKYLSKLFFGLSLALSIFMLVQFGVKRNSLHGDALGYYLYLPATFIYHNNTSLEKLPDGKGISDDVKTYVRILSDKRTPLGYTNNQYTYGVALMEAPFFFATHFTAKAIGRPANGFSNAYNYTLKFASLLYGILGLILVYKILRQLFPEPVALITTSLLLTGTNLFWFTILQGGMSHTPLFFLYAALMLLSIKLHNRPTLGRFVTIGLVAGLITIIRPTDIVCLFIPLLYNVYNMQSAIAKIKFIKDNSKGILAAGLTFFLPIIPQLCYWKYMTGSFLYYSYGDQSFSWLHPHIIEGLFYFSNGWLPYAMVMIFALAGFTLYKAIRPWAWALWVVFPVYVYIIYCWYCFNYINGLGSRPMLHIYPLLSVPLAAYLHHINGNKLFTKIGISAICLISIAINMSYSIQQYKGVLLSEQSNMKFNLQMLFRTELNYNDLIVNDIAQFQPDTSKIKKIYSWHCQTFEDSLNPKYVKDNVHGSKFYYSMGNDELAEVMSDTFSEQIFRDIKWIKCSGKFMYPFPPDYFKHLLVLDIDHKSWSGCKIENKIAIQQYGEKPATLDINKINTWGTVYYFVRVPPGLKNGHRIKLYLWNTGRRELYMDDLCVELYK